MSNFIWDKARLLHGRLNHAGAQRILKTLEIIPYLGGGVKLSEGILDEVSRNCLTCARGKQVAQAHYDLRRKISTTKGTSTNKTATREIVPRSTRPFEYLHIDSKYQMQKSFSGAMYGLIIVDDFSRRKWCLPMDVRSKAAQRLIEFDRREVKTHRGQITRILLDQAGEHTGLEFEKAVAHIGAIPQYTSTGDSKANGVAERGIQMVDIATRCHLIASDKPDTYWAEIANGVCQIDSILATTANPQFLPPYMRIYGTVPNVSKLKILGSQAYAYTMPKQQSSGFADTGREGVLVGLSKNLQLYRILLKATGMIVETAHAKIYEELPECAHDAADRYQPRRDTRSTVSTRGESTHRPPPQPPPTSSVVHIDIGGEEDRIVVPRNLAPFIDPRLMIEGTVGDAVEIPEAPPPPPPLRQQRARTQVNSLQNLANQHQSLARAAGTLS